MTKEYLETILTEYGVAFTDSLADRLLKEFEPCEDAISRVETVKFLANHSNEFEDKKIRMAFQSASSLVNNPHNLPPVNPQNCDTCEVGNPCLYCKHEFEERSGEK